MQHGPEVSDQRPPHELLTLVEEIIQHHDAGNSYGLLTKLTKRHWFEFMETVRIGRRALELNDATHLRAVRALLRMRQLRSALVERWERQMACHGGLACSELGERPEQVCKQIRASNPTLLGTARVDLAAVGKPISSTRIPVVRVFGLHCAGSRRQRRASPDS